MMLLVFLLLQWIISVQLLSDLNSWNMFLYLLLFSLYIAMGSMNTVTQEQREHVAAEGSHTSLSCEYTGSIYNVQWYRQQQGSRPEFLLYITESGAIHPTRSDFSADIDKTKKRGNLLISSAAVTDSAVPMGTNESVSSGAAEPSPDDSGRKPGENPTAAAPPPTNRVGAEQPSPGPGLCSLNPSGSEPPCWDRLTDPWINSAIMWILKVKPLPVT
ncbi:uncharacterized protein LOC103479963 [Poecilia reticulata]|uniref:uncharacterized protein LOC103479963 n=1 Tax=Poecilia reticulata TaxID=8081 RepID=UPI0004A29CBF|nr:PREDICTED: uncharacterized protein LOC103479963 [Poecilia reticulata]